MKKNATSVVPVSIIQIGKKFFIQKIFPLPNGLNIIAPILIPTKSMGHFISFQY